MRVPPQSWKLTREEFELLMKAEDIRDREKRKNPVLLSGLWLQEHEQLIARIVLYSSALLGIWDALVYVFLEYETPLAWLGPVGILVGLWWRRRLARGKTLFPEV